MGVSFGFGATVGSGATVGLGATIGVDVPSCGEAIFGVGLLLVGALVRAGIAAIARPQLGEL